MKRSVWVTALALVLAVGALIALSVSLSRTAAPLNMVTAYPWGDSTAAEGLTVHVTEAYADKLFWDTDYRVAEEKEETRFSFRPLGIPYRSSGTVGWKDEWYLTRLCLTDTGKYVTEDLLTGDAIKDVGAVRSKTVNVKDAFASYKIYLTENGNDVFPLEMTERMVPFDKIRIPIGDEDLLREEVYYQNRDGYSFNYWFWRQETRINPCTVGRDGHVLVTLGFAADAPVRADWAPEGFGLWDIPVQENLRAVSRGEAVFRIPVVQQARLVYPLDIVRQRVLALSETADGTLLLVTAEDERYVLRILDGETFDLIRELDLGPVETTTWSDEYSELTDYGAVLVRPEEDFTLITRAGRELMVLEEQADGWRIALRSPIMELRFRWASGENTDWHWEQAGTPDENGWEYGGPAYNPARESVLFSALSYRDGKLAVAYSGSITYGGNDVFVEVYGDGGMLYGGLLQNELAGQVYSHLYSVYTPGSGQPSLTWEG